MTINYRIEDMEPNYKEAEDINMIEHAGCKVNVIPNKEHVDTDPRKVGTTEKVRAASLYGEVIPKVYTLDDCAQDMFTYQSDKVRQLMHCLTDRDETITDITVIQAWIESLEEMPEAEKGFHHRMGSFKKGCIEGYFPYKDFWEILNQDMKTGHLDANGLVLCDYESTIVEWNHPINQLVVTVEYTYGDPIQYIFEGVD